MSKANNPVKVLRTALKRVQKGWTKGKWHKQEGDKHFVCLEGAIYGYCNPTEMLDMGKAPTLAQKQALSAVQSILSEGFHGKEYASIPCFNDAEETAKEDVMEAIKLGIVRLESGWPEEVPEEEIDDLFEHLDNIKI